LRLAFWLVVDLVIGILMLVFGDAKTQYAGLGIIGITLVVVVVIGVIGAVAGVGWGLESLFPHSGWRLEALAADLFLLGVLSLGLANLGVPSWNPILMAYVVVQVPLLVFGRTAGEFVAGVSVVHDRSEPRGLVGTLLEEAVVRLAVLQAVLVLVVWALRRLPGFETRWIEISTRHRIVGVTHSRARGLAAILALGLIGIGACSMSLAPATMADSANLNRGKHASVKSRRIRLRAWSRSRPQCSTCTTTSLATRMATSSIPSTTFKSVFAANPRVCRRTRPWAHGCSIVCTLARM